MPIQSVISATNPFLYWTLDAGAASDLGSGGNPGVAAGDISWTVPGIEVGKTALHLSAGASVLSPYLNWVGDFDISAAFFISHQPGTPNSATVGGLTMGNPGNNGTTNWGWLLQANVANAVPGGQAQWSPGLPWRTSWLQPYFFWHHIALTYTSSSRLTQVWIDGAASASGNNTGARPNIRTTDALTLIANYQAVVTHVALWQRVLSSTEISNIGSITTQWPYNLPYTSQIVVDSSTPVDLTPVLTDTAQILENQAAAIPILTNVDTTTQATKTQTTTIQTDTHNIVNTLFPQLADAINAILGAVTAQVTTAAGTVGHYLGDLFSHKVVDLITEVGGWDACAPDVIHAELGGATIFGIQMECTSHPDWITFTGWGNDYTQQSLGTLIISRGDNIILRKGLHNLTEMIYPMPAVPDNIFDQLLPVVPGQYTVVLTPAPETCWHLVGLGFP